MVNQVLLSPLKRLDTTDTSNGQEFEANQGWKYRYPGYNRKIYFNWKKSILGLSMFEDMVVMQSLGYRTSNAHKQVLWSVRNGFNTTGMMNGQEFDSNDVSQYHYTGHTQKHTFLGKSEIVKSRCWTSCKGSVNATIEQLVGFYYVRWSD